MKYLKSFFCYFWFRNMRYLYKVLMTILVFFSFHKTNGQDQSNYVVSTNRPNQTDAIGVMMPGYMQLEAGIGYSGSSGSFGNTNIIFFPSLQYRIGVIDNLEINAFYDYNSLRIEPDMLPNQALYSTFTTIGAKYHLWKERGAIPEAVGVFNVHHTNLDGNTYDWDVEFRLIFQNSITDRFSFAYMIRYRNDFAFALVPSYSINESWSVFVEYFSDLRINSIIENQNGINMGLGYLVNQRVTVDLMYGTLFINDVSNNLITTGVGWWIK